MEYESHSPKETRAIAAQLARASASGSVICINGGLGAGKTEFVKGFAEGLGIDEMVTSPTFTIMNEYEGRLPLYHFDVYRILSEEQMEDTGYEDFFYGDGISIVEWAELISGLIPPEAVIVDITKLSDNHRRIRIGRQE